MLRKVTSLILSFCLLLTQTGLVQAAAVELNLSGHFARMASSMAVDSFRPVHLRYFSYDSLNNSFKLLLDKGDFQKGLSPKGTDPEAKLKEETKELLQYFLIGVTLPNDKFWVNLRPDSPKQIIDFNLEETDIGKIMLEADLQLKKDTAAFTSPQTPEGKEYWNRLYKKAEEIYGQENITIPTLTRPWIVPNEIIVRETKDSAYVYKATLKVMLESDYLKNSPGAINSAVDYTFKDERSKALNEYSSQVIRELIIPKLTKEVNLSKRYAPLRQVYYSLILSRWFKSRFADKKGLSPQGTVPDFVSLIDKNNLTNLTSKDTWSKSTYFNEYKKSFSDGEYNIKEPVYTPSGQTIRNYFSGGMDFTVKTMPQGMPNGFASSSLTFDRRLPKTFIPVMGNGLRLWLDNPKNRQAAASLVTTHTPDELLRITKEIRSELNRERIRFRNREEAKAAISRILRNGGFSGGEANRVKSLFKTRRQKIWSLTEACTVEFGAVIPGEKYANEILARFALGFPAEGDIHLELSKLQPFFEEPVSLYYFIDALGGLATSNGNVSAPKIFAALDAYFIGLITQEDLRKAIGEIPEGSAAFGLYDCIERLKVIAAETTGSKVSSSAVEFKTVFQAEGLDLRYVENLFREVDIEPPMFGEKLAPWEFSRRSYEFRIPKYTMEQLRTLPFEKVMLGIAETDDSTNFGYAITMMADDSKNKLYIVFYKNGEVNIESQGLKLSDLGDKDSTAKKIKSLLDWVIDNYSMHPIKRAMRQRGKVASSAVNQYDPTQAYQSQIEYCEPDVRDYVEGLSLENKLKLRELFIKERQRRLHNLYLPNKMVTKMDIVIAEIKAFVFALNLLYGERLFYSEFSSGRHQIVLIPAGDQEPGASSVVERAPGGIDFKHKSMASATRYEAMGSFSGLDFSLPKLSSQALLSFNLDKEQSDISRAIDNGIIVSGQRIKEFMAASNSKGELEQRRETVITWLAKLGILEETTCCTQESSKEYREALVIADSAVI